MIKIEEGKSYVGVVEDNNDPKKLGRVRVRVLNVFDDLSVDDIPWARPWKDLNGNGFNIPDKGKIVTVIFESANIYKPEYISADHFNINLEKKLSGLSESDYLTMKALIFDHKTQIYVNEGEGLKMDHKFNVINIKDKSINVNLKDNFGKINLGTANSTQRAILGDNFLNWFDDFVKILIGDKGGPFLGNLGAPVIATPALMSNIQIYQQKKEPKFLSKNVYIVDNEYVTKLDRIAEGQKGDTWTSTVKDNNVTANEPVPYKANPGATTTQFDKPAESAGTQSAPGQSPEQNTPGTNPDSPPNTVEQANANASAAGASPKPDEHPDVPILLQIMNEKGYTVYTEAWKLNIIAVRNQCLLVGDKYTDGFVDQLYLLYKDDSGNWEVKQYKFSTMPGVEITITDQWISERPTLSKKEFWESIKGQKYTIKDYYKVESTDLSPNGELGLPILVPSQYIDVYFLGTYRGAEALLTHADSLQLVWFDKDWTKPMDFTPNNFTSPARTNSVGGGDFKINITRGYPGGQKVGDWSEGSHCFQDAEALSDFFSSCAKHKENHSNIFSYTLVTKRDWDAASRAVELDKTNQSPQPEQVSPSPTITDNTLPPTGTQSNTVSGATSSVQSEGSTDIIATYNLRVLNPSSDIESKITGKVEIKQDGQNKVAKATLDNLPNGSTIVIPVPGPNDPPLFSNENVDFLNQSIVALEEEVRNKYSLLIKFVST